MRYILSYLPLLFCFIIACNKPCPQPTFFDRVPENDTIHQRVFNTDTIYCTGDTVGYQFTEYAVGIMNLEGSKIAHISGNIFFKNNCIYLIGKDSPIPTPIFPMTYKGYADTFIDRRVYDKKPCEFKHLLKVDDVFYDIAYDDTIYKIYRGPLLGPDEMLHQGIVYFIGKHIGLIGYVEPMWEPMKNKYILLNRLGNFYPEKYNYDTLSYNFE